MQILVATLRGAVHQQQRAAAYAARLPSLQVARLSNHSGQSETSFLFFLVICIFSALNANPVYLKVRTCTRFLHLKAEGLTYYFALRSLDLKLIG